MLVLAGPGSGKTHVITHRIKNLIEEYKVKPEDILVITFTKAAANEMRERFIRLMDGRTYAVNFGTFHAVFFHILSHTYKLNADSIIREGDKYKLLRQIVEEMPKEIISDNESNKDKEHRKDQIIKAKDAKDSTGSYVKGVKSGKDLKYGKNNYDDGGTKADKGSYGAGGSNAPREYTNEILQHILEEISKVKNSGIKPEEHKCETVSDAEFQYICSAYKKEMNARKLVDFDDMVLLCRDLLMSRPDTLKMWQERFKYILIDEFQDICPLQYEVVRLLAKPQDNLFIVGDDDQSIYGFRGASPSIMLNFDKDYPSAERVLLNVNYRSKSVIVDTAARLISKNNNRFAKNVEAANISQDGVKIYAFESKASEAENINELIKQYMRTDGAKYSDIAILYRTAGSMPHTVRRLIQSNIPLKMKEKPHSIYESETAKDITAYIRYALKEDNISDFYRIINRPVRYVKRSTIPQKPFKMKELLQNNEGLDYVIQNVTQFYAHLQFIRQLTPFAAVNYIRKGVGYEDYIKKQGRDKALEELDELQECAKAYETLPEWLEQIEKELLGGREKNSRNGIVQTDAVSIMTMHASKGLEWKVVILPDINEGVVPHKRAITDSELEEERRMLYVAMTRAKESLFIFYVDEKKAGNFLPSRFIEEMLDM